MAGSARGVATKRGEASQPRLLARGTCSVASERSSNEWRRAPLLPHGRTLLELLVTLPCGFGSLQARLRALYVGVRSRRDHVDGVRAVEVELLLLLLQKLLEHLASVLGEVELILAEIAALLGEIGAIARVSIGGESCI